MSTIPKKDEIIIAPSTISTTDIAQYFDIKTKALNKIFLELQWLKRKYFLWLSTTKLGKEKGAKKGEQEILWKRWILGDKELILAIKNSKNITNNKFIDSNEYKIKVFNTYKKEGYTLWDYSKEKGHYDKNIHFVAKRNRDVVLIHCKSNQEDITLNEVLRFRENKQNFIAENPIFEIYNIKIKYLMPHFSLSEEAFKYLQKHRNSVFYKILK